MTVVRDEGGNLSSTSSANTTHTVGSLPVPATPRELPFLPPDQQMPYFYLPVPAPGPVETGFRANSEPGLSKTDSETVSGGKNTSMELAAGLTGAAGAIVIGAICFCAWKFVRPCATDFHRFRQSRRQAVLASRTSTPRQQRRSSFPMASVSHIIKYWFIRWSKYWNTE